MSNYFLPAGSWAVTRSPTFLPINVRASGDMIEMRPFAQQIEIEIGKDRRKAIGILNFDLAVAKTCL